MNRKTVGMTVLSAAVSVLSLTVFAAAPPKPKLTADQAKASAVKKIPGKALSAKYEFEDGRWQYAVIVQKHGGQEYEVEVNSTTGKVLDTEKTSPQEESKEAAADKKAAAKAKK